MQSTKTRIILAFALAALAYIVVMMLFHILIEHKDFIKSLKETAVSGVISGLLLWGLLKVINRKLKKISLIACCLILVSCSDNQPL